MSKNFAHVLCLLLFVGCAVPVLAEVNPLIQVSHVTRRDMVRVAQDSFERIENTGNLLFLQTSTSWLNWTRPLSRGLWGDCDRWAGIPRIVVGFSDAKVKRDGAASYLGVFYHINWGFNLRKMVVSGTSIKDIKFAGSVQMPTTAHYNCSEQIVFPYLRADKLEFLERVYCLNRSGVLLAFDELADRKDIPSFASSLRVASANGNPHLIHLTNFSSPIVKPTAENPSQMTAAFAYFRFNFSNATAEQLKENLDNSFVLFAHQAKTDQPVERVLDLSSNLADLIGVQGLTNLHGFTLQRGFFKANPLVSIVQFHGWVQSSGLLEGFQCLLDLRELKLFSCSSILKESNIVRVLEITTANGERGWLETRVTLANADDSVVTKVFTFKIVDEPTQSKMSPLNQERDTDHGVFNLQELRGANTTDYDFNIKLIRRVHYVTKEVPVGANSTRNQTVSTATQFVQVTEPLSHKKYFIYDARMENLFATELGYLVNYEYSGCFKFLQKNDYWLELDFAKIKEATIDTHISLPIVDLSRGFAERGQFSVQIDTVFDSNITVSENSTTEYHEAFPSRINFSDRKVSGGLHTLSPSLHFGSNASLPIVDASVKTLQWWTTIHNESDSKRVRLDRPDNLTTNAFPFGTLELFFSVPLKSLYSCKPTLINSSGNQSLECSHQVTYKEFELPADLREVMSFFLTEKRLTVVYTQNITEEMFGQKLCFTTFSFEDRSRLAHCMEEKVDIKWRLFLSNIVQTPRELYISYLDSEFGKVKFFYLPFDSLLQGAKKEEVGGHFAQMWSAIPQPSGDVSLGNFEVVVSVFSFTEITYGIYRAGQFSDYSKDSDYLNGVDSEWSTLGLCRGKHHTYLHDGIEIRAVNYQKKVQRIIYRGHGNSNRMITSMVCLSEKLILVTEANIIDRLWGAFLIRDTPTITADRDAGFRFYNTTSLASWTPHFFSNGRLYLSTGNRTSQVLTISLAENLLFTNPAAIHADEDFKLNVTSVFDRLSPITVNLSHSKIRERKEATEQNVTYQMTRVESQEALVVDMSQSQGHFWEFKLENQTLEKNAEIFQRFEYLSGVAKEGIRKFWKIGMYQVLDQDGTTVVERVTRTADGEKQEVIAKIAGAANLGLQDVVGILERTEGSAGQTSFCMVVKKDLSINSHVELHCGESAADTRSVKVTGITQAGQSDPVALLWNDLNPTIAFLSRHASNALFVAGPKCKYEQNTIEIDRNVKAFDFFKHENSNYGLLFMIVSGSKYLKMKLIDLDSCSIENIAQSELNTVITDQSTAALKCEFGTQSKIHCIYQSNQFIYLTGFDFRLSNRRIEKSGLSEEYIPYKNMVARQFIFDSSEVNRNGEKQTQGFIVVSDRIHFVAHNATDEIPAADMGGLLYYKLFSNQGTGYSSGGLNQDLLLSKNIYQEARIELNSDSSRLYFTNINRRVEFKHHTPLALLKSLTSDQIKQGVTFSIGGEAGIKITANRVKPEPQKPGKKLMADQWLLYFIIILTCVAILFVIMTLLYRCRKSKVDRKAAMKESLIENTITGNETEVQP